MKDIVSFETAKRLKEAGFPQPEFGRGQWWYRNRPDEVPKFQNNPIALMVLGRANKRTVFWSGYGRVCESYWDKEGYPFVFAPTATDIIRGFDQYHVSKWLTLGFEEANGNFEAYPASNPRYIFLSSNPAEACAEAWLKLNKK